MRKQVAGVLALISVALCVSPAAAWDAYGHRTITLVALSGLAKAVPELPAFLTDESTRLVIAYQSPEPDRYRGYRSFALGHVNNPDHYIDVEDLEKFGLTLSTIPPLRYEYLRAMAVAQHEHPESFEPSNPKLDPMRVKDWPGFLPHAIVEHQAKLGSAFKSYRTLIAMGDRARPEQIETAKVNIIAEMGLLSHFVGDAAQPLHTTQHHHGWVGNNPNGYTSDKGIHAYIDGTVLTIHAVTPESLLGATTFDRTIAIDDPWNDVLAHIQRSYDKVEPLYLLKKTGDLEREPGKAFIYERLSDAASMLEALYASAWASAKPSDKELKDYIKYDAQAPRTPPEPEPVAK